MIQIKEIIVNSEINDGQVLQNNASVLENSNTWNEESVNELKKEIAEDVFERVTEMLERIIAK